MEENWLIYSVIYQIMAHLQHLVSDNGSFTKSCVGQWPIYSVMFQKLKFFGLVKCQWSGKNSDEGHSFLKKRQGLISMEVDRKH